MKRTALPISKTEPVVTAKVGKNADLFPDILRLYIAPGSVIADVTYNKGRFWKGVQDMWAYTVLGSDIDDVIMSKQPEMWDRALKLKADMACLPYRNESLDAIVIDPPYAQGSSSIRTDSISKSYNLGSAAGRTGSDLLLFYSTTAKESKRVLRRGGAAIVKCQDLVNEGKQWWMHCDIKDVFMGTGFRVTDLFVIVQENTPIMQHDIQIHARKNHSYFWIFTKKAKT